MAAVAILLGWLVTHTPIVFADGLRYIEQARRLDRGDWRSGIREAVDHPLYPLASAATHRLLRLGESPLDWQFSAQVASAVAGVLLVIPLYLIAMELFGGSTAWLACLMVYLAPVTGHVLADALSEGWFLLFWTWGVWAALRYLRAGRLGWLGLSVALGSLSYFARPEGALLPVALGATLALCLVLRSDRAARRRWCGGLLVLTIGASALVGPYLFLKGGIGTKPAVARLFGLAPPSAAGAVERERFLASEPSVLTTYGLAIRATGEAIHGAVPLPILGLGILGSLLGWRRSARPRAWIFLSVVTIGWLLALIRLHATGGYCSPRHTLIVTVPLLAAAAAGIRSLTALVIERVRRSRPGQAFSRRAGGNRPEGPSPAGFHRPYGFVVASTLLQNSPLPKRRGFTFGRLLYLLPTGLLLAFALWQVRPLLAPLNAGMAGYRDAGEWLARHADASDRVIDVTGWSQFYGERTGYVFANLVEAPSDPSARWVVVRYAHVHGPWPYCARLRGLVDGARLVARFPAERLAGQSRVSLYERPRALSAGGGTVQR
jgi:4-amino-4-deoxy-L-arabinose transferase-like glycosyltransferase